MKNLIERARLLGALVVLLGLLGAAPNAALAQETLPEGSFDAAVADAVADESGSYYVGAACTYDADLDQSSCGFTAYASNLAAAEAFTVLYETVCGSATNAGGAEFGDAGYRYVPTAEAPSLFLTLPGAVDVTAETTTYEVEAGGVATVAAGDSLDCVQLAEEGDLIEDVVLVTTVDVAVYAYTCPAGFASLGECTLANDVEFAATDGGVPITVASTVGGATTATVAAGGTLVIGSTTAGFAPYGGNGTMVNVAEGSIANFVRTLGPDATPTDGRLQIVNGTCPTSGEARTEFTVIEPDSFAAQAQVSCEPNAGTSFIISGAALVTPITVTMDAGGTSRQFLAPGLYTVTEDSTDDSTQVNVYEDALSAVIVVNYLVVPEGTLEIRRYQCTAGTTESTSIEVYLSGTPTPAPAPPEAACEAADGTIQLNDGTPFDLGDDGAIVMDVPVDSYEFADLDTSTTESGVAVELGATTLVVITETVLTGTVSLSLADCDDSLAAEQDAADPAYWQTTCLNSVAGVDFWLVNDDLKSVGKQTTDSDGSAVWTNIDPGSYLIDTHANVCALFVNGADARTGFDVAIDQTASISLYTCAPLTSGGGTNIPGIDPPVLGVVSAPILDTTADALYVTELPSTGGGATESATLNAGGGVLALLGFFGAALALMDRKRRTRAA
ncbi:MAG: SpaA isopeptide-forming pilin-related protein [Chloroflexota bacterium]|nr:SpaA isopeptide-forming pilin-related protein [Chloroflexota bacterium]